MEACDLGLPTREDLKLIEETREEKVIVMLMLVIMIDRYVHIEIGGTS